MDYSELTKVHKLYGFDLSKETEQYLVYTQLIGFFRLAIVVGKKADFDCRNVMHDYEEIGFSCLAKNYSSLEEAQNELYKNYFRIHESRERAKNDYRQFCEAQTKRLASDYSYVNSGMHITVLLTSLELNRWLRSVSIDYLLYIVIIVGSFIFPLPRGNYTCWNPENWKLEKMNC